jgi:cell division protein FtsB
MRAELLQQVHAARKASQEATDACKGYKLKLGAAKSVVSLTKGNLDETTTKIGVLRGQLSQAQTEVEGLEQRNMQLSEEVDALKSELYNEIRMKVRSGSRGFECCCVG